MIPCAELDGQDQARGCLVLEERFVDYPVDDEVSAWGLRDAAAGHAGHEQNVKQSAIFILMHFPAPWLPRLVQVHC